MKLLLKLAVSTLVICTPFSAFAEKINAAEMKSSCLTGFMKEADKSSDPAAYKSYVNKLCDCSSTKLDGQDVDQNGVMAAIGMCMRVTLLTESMDKLKSDDALTEEKVTSTCMKEWQIFTSPNKSNQGTLEKSCACAAKEIMAVDKSKQTDAAQLDQIATTCVSKDS